MKYVGTPTTKRTRLATIPLRRGQCRNNSPLADSCIGQTNDAWPNKCALAHRHEPVDGISIFVRYRRVSLRVC